MGLCVRSAIGSFSGAVAASLPLFLAVGWTSSGVLLAPTVVVAIVLGGLVGFCVGMLSKSHHASTVLRFVPIGVLMGIGAGIAISFIDAFAQSTYMLPAWQAAAQRTFFLREVVIGIPAGACFGVALMTLAGLAFEATPASQSSPENNVLSLKMIAASAFCLTAIAIYGIILSRDGICLTNYERLRVGMPQEEVANILGELPITSKSGEPVLTWLGSQGTVTILLDENSLLMDKTWALNQDSMWIKFLKALRIKL